MQNGTVQETVNGMPLGWAHEMPHEWAQGMLLEWAHGMLLGRAYHESEVGPGVVMIREALHLHGEVLHEG